MKKLRLQIAGLFAALLIASTAYAITTLNVSGTGPTLSQVAAGQGMHFRPKNSSGRARTIAVIAWSWDFAMPTYCPGGLQLPGCPEGPMPWFSAVYLCYNSVSCIDITANGITGSTPAWAGQVWANGQTLDVTIWWTFGNYTGQVGNGGSNNITIGYN